MGRRRWGRSLLWAAVAAVVVTGCTVPGADDDPSRPGAVGGSDAAPSGGEEETEVEAALAPISGEQVTKIDQATDTAFTLPDDHQFEDGDVSSDEGSPRVYSFNGWEHTLGPDRQAVEVRFYDDAATVEEALAGWAGRPVVHEEPIELDGVAGRHVVHPPSLDPRDFGAALWAAPVPSGGVVVVHEPLDEEGDPLVAGPITAASIRFDVGYRSGPTEVLAPLRRGPDGDLRTVVTTDPPTGISWRMVHRDPGSRGGIGEDYGPSFFSPRPEDRLRTFERVWILSDERAPGLREAVLTTSFGGNIEILDTAEPITIAGREGLGGTATFEGSRMDPPRVERVWAVAVPGGHLVLESFRLGVDGEPPDLAELAATVTIPETAVIPDREPG